MIRTITSATLILAMTGFVKTQEGFLGEIDERMLQTTTTNTTSNTTIIVKPANQTSPVYRGLKFYGDAPRIAHTANLGCGACIRGGYSYCIPSKVPGSDPATWMVGKKAVCCKDDLCVTATLKDTTVSWTCSTRNYTAPVLALGMCPYTRSRCGSANSTLNFTESAIGQSQTINISLALGETCTYRVETKCGLPDFAPITNTTGFDIQVIDFDEDDINTNAPAVPVTSLQQVNISSSMLTTVKKTFDAKVFQVMRPNSNITKGLLAKTFNPDEGKNYKFKFGKRLVATENICKTRYQIVSITPLGEIANATIASRILQTATTPVTYNMTVQFSTSEFSTSSAMMLKAMTLALVAAFVILF